jgi:hypothetical protein
VERYHREKRYLENPFFLLRRRWRRTKDRKVLSYAYLKRLERKSLSSILRKVAQNYFNKGNDQTIGREGFLAWRLKRDIINMKI